MLALIKRLFSRDETPAEGVVIGLDLTIHRHNLLARTTVAGCDDMTDVIESVTVVKKTGALKSYRVYRKPSGTDRVLVFGVRKLFPLLAEGVTLMINKESGELKVLGDGNIRDLSGILFVRVVRENLNRGIMR
jgi:hypothetical protein